MSKVAREISGLSAEEIREMEYTVVLSKKEISQNRLVRPRGNVRFLLGRVSGYLDREKRREKILRHTPRCLKG